jgi:hypothetical protein
LSSPPYRAVDWMWKWSFVQWTAFCWMKFVQFHYFCGMDQYSSQFGWRFLFGYNIWWTQKIARVRPPFNFDLIRKQNLKIQMITGYIICRNLLCLATFITIFENNMLLAEIYGQLDSY